MTGVVGPDGTEWVPAVTALDRVPGLSGWTLRSWIRRERVRSQRVGRQVWVAWGDVLEVEAAAHMVGWRRGRRARHVDSAGQAADGIAQLGAAGHVRPPADRR